jgi:hypothetical protein
VYHLGQVNNNEDWKRAVSQGNESQEDGSSLILKVTRCLSVFLITVACLVVRTTQLAPPVSKVFNTNRNDNAEMTYGYKEVGHVYAFKSRRLTLSESPIQIIFELTHIITLVSFLSPVHDE